MVDRDDGSQEVDETDDQSRPVRDVLNRLEDRAQEHRVALGELVEASGVTSFVPALMVPALLVVSPLSGVPFFSSICGITIAFIAAQLLFKREHLFLPNMLLSKKVSGRRLREGLKKLRRVADYLDRHTQVDRLHQFVGPGGRIIPQILCVIAGALMPFLEIIPFSSSILGAAVLSFSVGLLTRDGIFVLVGMAIMATAGALPLFVFGVSF
tara:strand:- start:4438 stop:5070 length:633 start_codon:yes stop_codon:yes gene_type:complete